MKRGFRARKFFFILLMIAAGILVVSAIVMLLWNAVLPDLLHVSRITFWQAAGLLILSKLLFSGFHGGRDHRRAHEWKKRMKAKWERMTPEEREKFRQEMRNRCRPGWYRMEERFREESKPAPEATRPEEQTGDQV